MVSIDLRHHGDADIAPGLVDLAVNVRAQVPPGWLVDAITADPAGWAAYPDPTQAREALAVRHGVRPDMVLPTAGATEAFSLVAAGLRPRRPVVVHPQFTEPEAALTDAGISVRRHLLEAPFTLDPATVPDDADLVVVGNPTNPTGVLHPAEAIRALRRPGRVVLVDEAFMDFVPGEAESMLRGDLTGVLVTRSLTKMWGLAGLRVGYVVGDPELIVRLAAVQRPWSVSTPAIDALVACSTPDALAEADAAAHLGVAERESLVRLLAEAGFPAVGDPQTPFVLIDTSRLGSHSVRQALAEHGFAVRRGETFPGLGPHWIRVAVRDEPTSLRFVRALGRELAVGDRAAFEHEQQVGIGQPLHGIR